MDLFVTSLSTTLKLRNTYIQGENVRYRLPRYGFKRESEMFRDSNNINYEVPDGVTNYDFESLAEIIYP